MVNVKREFIKVAENQEYTSLLCHDRPPRDFLMQIHTVFVYSFEVVASLKTTVKL